MSSELLHNLNQASSQIALKLDAKGLLFLIKSGDQYFDDFFIDQLIEIDFFQKRTIAKSLSDLQRTLDQAEKSTGLCLVEIPRFDEDLIGFFTSLLASTKKQSTSVVYLFPNYILSKFIVLPSKESFLSSCEFISEKLVDWSIPALHGGLQPIFGDKNTPIVVGQFAELVKENKTSIGKAIFFAKNFNQDPGKLSEALTANQAHSLFSFLDQKGSEFVSAASKEVSLDVIQAFFRSFVFVERSQSFALELERNEVYSFTHLPKEQLDYLLNLAISPSFQLLSERNGSFRFTLPEYLQDWMDLNRWVLNEEAAIKQFKQLEVLAADYFNGTGTLLSKEQIDQALSLEEEVFSIYNWDIKYKTDKQLLSSYLLLSQNHLEELIKTQQKKRASLIRNSIRISIAVSIAFLLSSFTALLAYLERNSAVVQQELAIKSKEEAEQARVVAEKERLEAVQARENEQSALQAAEEERILALEAKGQAEVQRMMAVDALILAKKSEQEASFAKDVAQQNEKLANEAKITAQVNFETSEKLRNQQEARATALEALGYFANENFEKGIDLVKSAYKKNLASGGFPLQSDIFNALLNGMNTVKAKEFEVNLTYPAKLLALSPGNEKIAVYTINGEIHIYSTQPKLSFNSVIQTGYVKSFEFMSKSEILGTNLSGNLFFVDLSTGTVSDLSTKLPLETLKSFIKVVSHPNLWIAKLQDGSQVIYQYDDKNGFVTLKKDQSKLLVNQLNQNVYWIEGNEFFRSNVFGGIPELVAKTSSTIHSASWSTTHSRWMLGLENGQIWSVDPSKEVSNETFAIHATKVSQLVTMPYLHDTELMLSTGFDGGLTIFVFDKKIPLSASVSSRIKFQGHKSWITGFSVDESKKIAYSISNDRTLKVWPLDINELLEN